MNHVFNNSVRHEGVIQIKNVFLINGVAMTTMTVRMHRMRLTVSKKIRHYLHHSATQEFMRSHRNRVLILPGYWIFHPKIWFFFSFLNIFFCFVSRPYLTISGESRLSLADDINKDYPTTVEDPVPSKEQPISNGTSHQSTDEHDDIIQGAASGITVPLSKSLANFQDSKEIMMTSDSESDYKFSSTNNVPSNTAHVSPCPQGELRCVNGRCITLSQLCDKVRCRWWW